MSYGMRVWGADGVLQLDENSFTMRIVYSFLVTFTGGTKQSQIFSTPGCNTANTVAIFLPIGPYDSGSRQHKAILSDNGTVTAYNYLTENPGIVNISGGTMRLILVKFK